MKNITEEEFICWFAANASDCEEALSDISERFERLLQRVGLHIDDPIVDPLREYLFSEFEPIN